MEILELYFYKVLAELENAKSIRSFKERTNFDPQGKKMRRKLEKGYLSGINSSIKVLKKIKKDFDKLNEMQCMEDKERTFTK